MAENEPRTRVDRKRTLTDADLKALYKIMQSQPATPHPCRFDNVSCEDMDFIKDLLAVYKETRSEVIKWLVKGVIYGSLIVLAIGMYLKARSQ